MDAALAPILDENGASDKSQAVALLNRKWALTQQWIINYLNTHQWEGDIDLKPALRRLSMNYSSRTLDSVELDKQAYLVSTRGSIGAPFIAAKVSGQYRVVWNVPASVTVSGRNRRKLAAGATAYLAPWTAKDEMDDLAPSFVDSLGKLTDDSKGRHRYFFDTGYHHEAGATFPGQLTVWRWDGTSATLLLAIDNRANECTPGIRFDGRYLHVPTRSAFKVLWAANSSCGHVLDQLIRVDRDSARYVGSIGLAPQLNLIDTILDRINRKKSGDDLAARRVIRILKRLAGEASTPPRWRSMVGFDYSPVRGRGKFTSMCVGLDFQAPDYSSGHASKLLFRFVRRKGNLYASDVRAVDDGSCDDRDQY